MRDEISLRHQTPPCNYYDRDPGQFDVEIHATDLSECSYEVIKDKVCLWRAVKHAACNQRVRVNAPQRDTPRAASSVCFSVCLSAGVGVSVCVRVYANACACHCVRARVWG